MYIVINSNNIPQCRHYTVNADGTCLITHDEECYKGKVCVSEKCCKTYNNFMCDYCKTNGNIYSRFSHYIISMMKHGWKCQGGIYVCHDIENENFELIQAMIFVSS
jgi:hypothetical protein